MKEIIKRDGRKEKFDVQKISNAFAKAYKEVYGEDCIIPFIDWEKELIVCFGEDKTISVEDIQDCIFFRLCEDKEFGVAKAFQEYRTRRIVERENKLEKIYNDIDKILKQGSTENANKNSTLHGVKRDLMAGEFFRNKLEEYYPKNVVEAHRKKIIHLHDSDYDPSMTNCSLVNIPDMLENGFKINSAKIGEPNSIQVASNVIMQISANVSASQYGGVSISDFNEILAKYAKKNFRKNFINIFKWVHKIKDSDIDTIIFDLERDYGFISSDNKSLAKNQEYIFKEARKKTDKEIYDACQLFEYQTNSILGSASQTPFSTITFNIPTSWESERIIYNYLKVRQNGVSNDKDEPIIAIFPKLSMIVVDGYNLKKEDKYYYLLEEASKCIAKTYYPDLLLYKKEDYDNNRYFGRMGRQI